MWVALLACVHLASAQAPAQQLLAEIEAFDTQAAMLTTQIETLRGTLAAAESDRQAKLSAAEAAEQKVASRAGTVTRLVHALYRIRRLGLLRLLFGAEDPVELRRRAYYIEAVIAAHAAKGAQYTHLAAEGRAAAAAAASANAATRQLEGQLVAQRDALDVERKRRLALLREVQRQPALAGQYQAEVSEARATFSQSVATSQSTLPASVGGNDTASFRALRGKLRKPLAAGRLLRGFGGYADPATGARLTNLGVDWQAAAGSPFVAVADGVVTRAGYVRSYGQMVMLQHGAYTTLYAHASALRVGVDQRVHAGDPLGTVGATGVADGGQERLHFEIRYNGTPQDPAEWLSP